MTAPVIRQYPGTIPDKGQAQTAFDTNVDAFLDWQALQFAPDLVAFGTWTTGVANTVLATALAGDLPALTGKAGNYIRANNAEDGGEFLTPAQVRDDIGANDADNLTTGKIPLGRIRLSDEADWTADPTLLSDRENTKLFVGASIPTALNASGSAPMYACRAWVNFRGNANVSIRGSGNVSSITDNGTGSYTVNFTTAMSDTNYAVVATAGRTGFVDTNASGGFGATPTASAYRINTFDGGNSVRDCNFVNVAIFR